MRRIVWTFRGRKGQDPGSEGKYERYCGTMMFIRKIKDLVATNDINASILEFTLLKAFHRQSDFFILHFIFRFWKPQRILRYLELLITYHPIIGKVMDFQRKICLKFTDLISHKPKKN